MRTKIALLPPRPIPRQKTSYEQWLRYEFTQALRGGDDPRFTLSAIIDNEPTVNAAFLRGLADAATQAEAERAELRAQYERAMTLNGLDF